MKEVKWLTVVVVVFVVVVVSVVAGEGVAGFLCAAFESVRACEVCQAVYQGC